MGFDNPELEIRLQQARRACESNADRMHDACQGVKGTKRRVKIESHDGCNSTCACKSVSSGKVLEQRGSLPIELPVEGKSPNPPS